MFFKKKKLVDIRAAERMGMVRTPAKSREVDTNMTMTGDGYLDASKIQTSSSSSSSQPTQTSKGGLFGFFDSPSTSGSKTEFSTEKDGYSKVEVDRKIEEMDNKIYKLEQRVELLERKVGVGGSGW